MAQIPPQTAPRHSQGFIGEGRCARFLQLVQLPVQHLEAVKAHLRHGVSHRLAAIATGGRSSMSITQVPVGVTVHHGPFPGRATPALIPVGTVSISVRIVSPVELRLLRPTTTGRHAVVAAAAAGTLLAATATAAAAGVAVFASTDATL